MMLCGTPYLNINSLMKLIAVQVSRFLIGLASIHLVNLSTATSTCAKPLLPVLNGPTISSPQTAKGQRVEWSLGLTRVCATYWSRTGILHTCRLSLLPFHLLSASKIPL